jgi:hypothetical protein
MVGREKENIDDDEAYEIGMRAIRAHHEECCFRVMKSRNENAGNFKYIESRDFKREERLAQALELLLSRFHLRKMRSPIEGHCGMECDRCPYIRYNIHSKRAKAHWCNDSPEGWTCQEECECK